MNAEQASDEELVAGYLGGDSSCFRILLARHKSGLFSYLVRSTKRNAVAEELFQEVWARVIENAPRYKPEARFRTWLYAIARNACIDEARRASYRRTEVFDENHARGLLHAGGRNERGGDVHATDRVSQLEIERALAVLPHEQREVFLLREVSGLSFDEIAAVLDRPVGTVKSRMRYALERLRELLRDSSSPPPNPLCDGAQTREAEE